MHKYTTKIITPIILSIIFFVSALPVYATMTDIKGNWAEKEIQRWGDRGILSGSGGKFRPDAYISRAEFAAIVNRVFRYQESKDGYFSDVKKSDWFAADIGKAVAAGMLKGYNGKVRPKDPVSRQEAAVILSKAFSLEAKDGDSVDKYKDAAAVPAWSKNALNAMIENGYMSNRLGSTLNPAAYISRAEAVKMLDNIVGGFINKPGTYAADTVEGSLVVNTGNVTISAITVNGNLYLTQGIGSGSVTLENVTVNGMTVVNGGGEKGIILKDSTLKNKLVAAKTNGKDRIAMVGDTSISEAAEQPADESGKGTDSGTGVGAPAAGGVPAGGGIGAGGAADKDALKLLGASVLIGGQRVNAALQANGEWLVDLTGWDEVLSFTDLTVRASSDVVKAEVAYSLFSETVDFRSGSANVNVHGIMGALDTGEPGISILSIKGLGINRFTVTLIDGSGGSSTVAISLQV